MNTYELEIVKYEKYLNKAVEYHNKGKEALALFYLSIANACKARLYEIETLYLG